MAELETPVIRSIIQPVMYAPPEGEVESNVVHTLDNVVHSGDNVTHTD